MATRTQLKNQQAERYVKSMLRNIKARGNEPIKRTPEGVVVEDQFGGGTFTDEVQAYMSIYLFLMRPKAYTNKAASK